MEEPSSDKNNLQKAFPKSLEETRSIFRDGYSEDPVSSSMQYYAIGSEIGMHFDLIMRTGNEYSIPYSLLPVFVLSGGGQITIKAHELLISIEGRNLRPIRNYLKEQTLLWLKESPSGKDDGQTSVFISNILIEGKTVSLKEDN